MNDKEIENQLQNLGRKIDQSSSRADAVLSRLEHEPDFVTTGAQMKPPFPLVRVLLALAACLLVLLGATSLWYPPSGRALAFSQVQELLKDFETLVMRVETEGIEEMSATIYVVDDGRYRFEFKNGLARVFDPETGATLGLNPEKDEYSLTNNDHWEVLSQYRTILDAKESAVEKLGLRDFDGQLLAGYMIMNGEDALGPPQTELWCDPESGRPVMMIETGHIPQDAFEQEHRVVVRFEFDQPIDDSLLSMVPPEGYAEVDQVPLLSMPALAEEMPVVDDQGNLEDLSMRLYPGQGIFNVKLGDSRESVVKIYGPSSETRYFYERNGEKISATVRPADVDHTEIEVVYNAFGISFRFNADDELTKVVAEIEFEDLGRRGFPGRTLQGIRIGDDVEAIKAAYGEPELVRGEADAPFALGYDSQGIFFVFEDGAVGAIIIKDKK